MTSCGNVIGGCALGMTHSAIQAEALACLKGMKWALASSLHEITILQFSPTMIILLQVPNRGKGRISNFTDRCLAFILQSAKYFYTL